MSKNLRNVLALELIGRQVRTTVEAKRTQTVSRSEVIHEELLETVWSNLRPGVRRTAAITAEWGEVLPLSLVVVMAVMELNSCVCVFVCLQ